MAKNCKHNFEPLIIDCSKMKLPDVIYFPRFEGKYDHLEEEVQAIGSDYVTTILCPDCGQEVEV